MAPVGISVNLVNVIVGPILIGSWLNIWLYGMMLIQAREYYRTAENDPKWIKYMVGFILVADTLNSVFDAWAAYYYSVSEFGNAEAIFISNWAFSIDPAMTVIVSSTVQSFFGWRVKKLTGKNWLVAIIIVLAIAQFLAGIGSTIASVIIPEFVRFHKFKTIVIVWLVLAPLADFIIAASLTWYLRTHKTGFPSTDGITSRITRMAIQTGAITVVWSTINLVLFLCFANNLHMIFNMPLAKLYGNCLMSSLNARREWKGKGSSQGLGYPTSEDRPRHPSRGVSIITKTEVIQEAHELQISSNNRPGFVPSNPRQQIAIRVNGGATHPEATAHGDGLSLNSDVTGYGDESK